MFGYRNHVGIDREHGFVRRHHPCRGPRRGQLGAVLDPGNTASAVSADTAYRSAANIAMLERRGLKPEFQRSKPGGKSMPLHMAATSAAPHPFARRHRGAASTIRTVGKARATAKLALANLAYNFTRLA